MSCPVCAGVPQSSLDDRGTAFAGEFGSSRSVVSVVSTVLCKTCGSASQFPLPSAEQLHRIYSTLDDAVYLAESVNRRRAAERSLRLVHRYASPQEGALLDVGCASGFFLEAAQDAGWDVAGVEPSASMAKIARRKLGDRIIHASFENAQLEGARFSVITLWDVLEHVRDPWAFLRRAAALMPPGAHLFINVPRQDSIIAKLLGKRWPLRLPEHLHYFTLNGLRTLLNGCGFTLPASHPHVVWFSTEYVLSRLGQHGVPLAGGAAAVARVTGLSRLAVPLLMGEVTVVATRGNVTPQEP